MTKATVKSAEVAKAIVAAILPNATPEKKNYFTFGSGKVQNRFFEDVKTGLSYCLAYASDCETLELVNFFDENNNVVATVEIDSETAENNVDGLIEEISNELGIKAEVKKFEPQNKTFMIGKVYHLDLLDSEKYMVMNVADGYVTLKQIETKYKKIPLGTCRYKIRIRDNYDEDGNVVGVIQFAKLRVGLVEATDEVIDPAKANEKEETMAEILAHFYRVLGLDHKNANAELDACIDDYIVDVDAAAEVEEVNARNAVFEVSKKRGAFIANVFSKCGKFSIKLARADEEKNFHEDEDGLWTVRLTEKDVGYLNELYYYEEDGKFTLALMRGLTDYNLAVYDTEEEVQKAIIAIGAAVKRGDKIFTFPAPRKSIIDWDAAYKEIRLAEIFSLQKEFKKLLKLGELKRAANVFENIKMIFKAA